MFLYIIDFTTVRSLLASRYIYVHVIQKQWILCNVVFLLMEVIIYITCSEQQQAATTNFIPTDFLCTFINFFHLYTT